jgi:hypothetical protein
MWRSAPNRSNASQFETDKLSSRFPLEEMGDAVVGGTMTVDFRDRAPNRCSAVESTPM